MELLDGKLNIFNEKVDILVPFQRNDIINEMADKIQRTFCSIYKYFDNSKNYSECVQMDRCNNYAYHKQYLCNQHFFFK